MDFLPIQDFNLALTLRSGQFFQWRPDGEAFLVRAAGHAFRVSQRGDRLEYEGTTSESLTRLFSLDLDLPAITATFSHDPWLYDLVRRYPGLRLMRQDPWECAVSFILSIVSNIPRITRNVEDLSRRLGSPVTVNGSSMHALPRPAAMADARRLRGLRLGFRARYLAAAARLVRSGHLEGVDRLPTEEARMRLMELPGVAVKVADCILLFAYGRMECFPVDTWIRRAMVQRYFRRRRVPDRTIVEFARRHFGPYAGYAQQYMYMMARQSRLTSFSGGSTMAPLR